MTYSNLIEPISPKESPAELPDASVDGDDNTDGDIKQIVETGSVTVSKDGHYIHCLTVIGQIEGHFILPPQNKTTKYEHVIPQLVAIEESRDIEGLIIILNTVGGDIEAGLALAELLSGMRKPTVSLVLGGGAFNRRAVGGFRKKVFYCAVGNNDCASGANERACTRCSSNIVLF